MTPSPSRNHGVAETIHETRGLAARYGIGSTSTVVLFKEEAVIDRVGAAPRGRAAGHRKRASVKEPRHGCRHPTIPGRP